MGLSIAAFIPEGIIISCDLLSEIKNSDDGFYQKANNKLFTVADRFVICIESDGFYKGLPISYYVRQISHRINCSDINTTGEFLATINTELTNTFPDINITAYVGGIDYKNEGSFSPVLAMIEDGNIHIINMSEDSQPVYNYHAIGRSFWINKMMMETSAVDENDNIAFPRYDIDFSKYSCADAISFTSDLIKISAKMDRYCQMKPKIGDSVQTVALIAFEKPRVL